MHVSQVSSRLRAVALSALVALALLAAACGGSSDDQAVSPTGGGTDSASEPDAAIGDVPSPLATDEGPEAAPTVEVPEVEINNEMVSFVAGQILQAPIADDEATCLVDNLATDADSARLVRGVQIPEFVPEPQLYSAFAGQLQQCVDPSSLAQALAGFTGSNPADQESFVACMTPRIGAEDGRELFIGLNSIGIGQPIADTSLELTTDAMSACIPPVIVAGQFAQQTEAGSGYTLEVDLDCVTEGWDQAGLADRLWEVLIDRDAEAMGLLDQTVQGCAAPYDSGLAQEVPGDFVAWDGQGTLAGVDPLLRNAIYAEQPPMTIDTSKSYEAIITTTDGEIRLALFDDESPITVNNFVSLARDGFYDATFFHRVLDGFMAQGGDPTGTGGGGPGYQFEDEVDNGLALDRPGIVAMANAGPGTNGSQFFITFGATEHLNGLHTVFGEVIEGDDVVSAIDLRDPASPTSRGEQIISIEIIES